MLSYLIPDTVPRAHYDCHVTLILESCDAVYIMDSMVSVDIIVSCDSGVM